MKHITKLKDKLFPAIILKVLIFVVSLFLSPASYAQVISDEIKEEELIPPKYKAALLIPLSGKHKNIGDQMVNAAILAVQDAADNNMILNIYDTGDSPDKASQAFNEVASSEPNLIIGPVFSEDTRSFEAILKEQNKFIISFSNDQSLKSENIFIFGLNPYEQIKRLVDYTYKQGIVDYFALFPLNIFGQGANLAIKDALREHDLKLKRFGQYNKADEKLSVIIKSVLSEFSNTKKADQNTVMFIPEGGQILSIIIGRMQSMVKSAEKIRPIGTAEWESEETVKNPKLLGGWFAAPMPPEKAEFEKRFVENFDSKPSRLSALAYDAVSIAVNQAQKGDSHRDDFIGDLSYKGVTGNLRFKPDGSVERLLDVVEITEYGFAVIDPAPQDFDIQESQ